jgi:hypothetical protein
MDLVDALVNRAFRDTANGRVIVFSGDPRKRGYLVRSPIEERKTKAFLKMFYFAHLYVLVFGLLLSQAWASSISGLLYERPAHHLVGSVLTSVAVYLVVVAAPYVFLWRAYRRALESFGTPADEVPLTGLGAPKRQWILLASVGFAILILAAVLALAVKV